MRIMRTLLVVGPAWCLVSIPVQGQSQAGSDPQATAIALLTSAIQSIRTYDVMVEVTTRHLIVQEHELGPDRKLKLISSRKLREGEKGRESHRREHQIYTPGKGRYEIFDEAGKIDQIVSHNSELTLSYRPKKREATTDRPGISFTSERHDYSEGYRFARGRIEILRLIRDRSSLIKVERTGPNQRDYLIIIPRTKETITLNSIEFRITIDSTKRYFPSMIERHIVWNGKPLLGSRTTVSEYRQISPELLAPIRFKTVGFDYDGKETYGLPSNETEVVVDMAKSRWNIDIPESSLEQKLPIGTRVADFASRQRYVTGKADTGKNIADLVEGARDVMQMSPLAYQVEPEPVRWWRYGLLSAGAILLATLAWWLYRVRKRRAGAGQGSE